MTLGGQNTSGIDTFSGNITLGSGSAGQSLTISEPSGGELDLTGGILAGPTAAGITINGGLVKLTNGSSTYTGTTTVSTGTLRVTNTSGSATGTGSVNVSSGAVLGGGAGGTTGDDRRSRWPSTAAATWRPMDSPEHPAPARSPT